MLIVVRRLRQMPSRSSIGPSNFDQSSPSDTRITHVWYKGVDWSEPAPKPLLFLQTERSDRCSKWNQSGYENTSVGIIQTTVKTNTELGWVISVRVGLCR